jgi:hypothetical protein
MEGVGTHHSKTHEQRIVGHRLVQERSVLLDRRCPLAPQVSRQEKMCASEAVARASTMALMETRTRTFEPVGETRTHVVLDRWSCATGLWRAARDRDVLITTGLTITRWLRITDDTARHTDGAGRGCARLWYASWPRGGKMVSVHVVNTRGRTRFCCQVVIVRQSLSALLSQARSCASSDLDAKTYTLRAHLSARWDRDVLTATGKEERGLDHSRLMSAQAQVTLAVRWLCWSPSFWKKSRTACRSGGNAQRPLATLDATSSVAIVIMCYADCMSRSFLASTLTRWLTYWPLRLMPLSDNVQR